jgi:hypothetical protein
VAKIRTSKAGGTISQQAAVHPWLAADAQGNKQQTTASIFRVEELAQKMDAAVSFETLVPTHQTARRHIPEYDSGNLKVVFCVMVL